MISHCCTACGRPLDASSRTYSRPLRMWIARCPRCGHAVRWNPAGARKPYRVWARLRALNLRFGVAFGAGQVAGVASIVLGAQLVENYITLTRFEQVPTPTRSAFVFLIATIGVAAALAAAISAVFISPRRSVLLRVLLAWTLGALPVVLVVSLIPICGAYEARFEVTRAFTTPGMLERSLAICAAVPLCSLVIAIPLAALWNAAYPGILRRQRALSRATLAPAHAPRSLPTP